MAPWDYPIPPILYKYLRSDRLSALTDSRVRFSQRTVFDDDHELQPEYASFGTEKEIWRFILASAVKLETGGLPLNIVIRLIAMDAEAQARAMTIAQRTMRTPDEVGVFCMTEDANSPRMWREYADEGKGYAIGFDTTHQSFMRLTNPGRLGKV